jgi:hypothetical protein
VVLLVELRVAAQRVLLLLLGALSILRYAFYFTMNEEHSLTPLRAILIKGYGILHLDLPSYCISDFN